jgi:hypothetical protein
MKRLLIALTAMALFAVSLPTQAVEATPLPASGHASANGPAPASIVNGGGTGHRHDDASRTVYDGDYSSNSQLGSGRYSLEIADDLHDVATFSRADGMIMTGTVEVLIQGSHPDTCMTAFGVTGVCMSADLTGTADVASASILIVLFETTSSDETTFLMDAGAFPRHPIGYAMVGTNGTTYGFGGLEPSGNAPTSSAVDIERVPAHYGDWVVDSVGRVYAFQSTPYFGSADPREFAPGERVTSLSATPTGNGYWLFTNRGRVIAFGDAHFLGDMRGRQMNGNVIGSIATPTGQGYYMVGSDGGVFSFGDATFRGSMGNVRLNQPVVGLVPAATNRGYWLVASDGGVFSFNAPFHGSMGSTHLNRPIVSMVRYGSSYLMIASDGGAFNFSTQPFFGSLGGTPIPAPIVGATSVG